ncbi:MAG: peptidoglycan editing factor PgeF [Magnetococcales bacterium]|nr:peptidoglycan editing factor PgeF [Magnetococcales bacterium]
MVCTTRGGGVSSGPFASLNLAGHVADDSDRVLENRKRLATRLGRPLEALRFLEQVHGVATVFSGEEAPSSPPVADAQVTDRPGLLLAVLTADCAPVLLADPRSGVIGAAHAGWRGALDGVLESCLHSMTTMGARPYDIRALIGPCIRQSAFQVGGDVHARFLATDTAFGQFFAPETDSDRYRFDLPGLLRLRLLRAGLAEDCLYDVGHCTYTENHLFFSHRHATRNGLPTCGRQLSAIGRLPG